MDQSFKFVPPKIALPTGAFGSFLQVEPTHVLTKSLAPSDEIPHNLKDAVLKRQNEFYLGRLAANEALKKADAPMLHSSDHTPGEPPQWPPSFTGSITHTAGLIGAVVCNTKDFSGVGLDAESLISEKTANRITTQILTAHEQVHASDLAQELNCTKEAVLTLFFSAKEAIYKANWSRYPERNRFHDVELVFAKNQFEYRWQIDSKSLGGGLFTFQSEHVITLVTVS